MQITLHWIHSTKQNGIWFLLAQLNKKNQKTQDLYKMPEEYQKLQSKGHKSSVHKLAKKTTKNL